MTKLSAFETYEFKRTNPTIYSIKDNFANPRAKYGEIFACVEFVYNPKVLKTLDTCKPYRHTYYFSTEEKRDAFLNMLAKKYYGEE